MNRGQIILTLTLTLFAASAAWAQGDENQPPVPAPVPAFGQENPAPSVSENPPISGIDQPGLEPHAAPESFLLVGLHFSESVDSNVGDQLGGSSTSSVTRGLGSLTLQKLWKNYDVALDYIGGASYYHRKGLGLEQLQQLDIDNRINWKRGQLAIRDSFSYLPEGTFGFGSYGGGGAYSAGLSSLGSGLLGAGAFSGQNNIFNSGGVSVGQVPRLTNLGMADIVESLTPKSSVTVAAGYGIVHFYGLSPIPGVPQTISFIGSREETAQVGYNRILNPRTQVALTYAYQGFDFSTSGTAFHSNVIQAMYGYRISGRMDLTLGAGPQFTHIDSNPVVCTFLGFPLNVPLDQCTKFGGTFTVEHQNGNHIGLAARASLRYRFSNTNVALSYLRYNTSGNGVFAGSRSDSFHMDVRRRLTRVWDLFTDLGYAKNSRLQVGGSTQSANKFSYTYAGVGLHRQFSRSLRGYVSYQFNYVTFDQPVCPTGSALAGGLCQSPIGPVATVPEGRISQRHVGSIGLDWTPRPIRLD
jgi:hypothetical protein